MSNRRAQARASRLQKIVAIVLLLCLALSGLAFFAASTTPTNQPAPSPTQQGR